jgi:hypothetical protein
MKLLNSYKNDIIALGFILLECTIFPIFPTLYFLGLLSNNKILYSTYNTINCTI